MITLARWQQLTLPQQLGHVASEVSRARHWEEANDKPNRNSALERALELLDLSIADPRFRNRLKEILRLREILGDWYADALIYGISPRELENYCQIYPLYSGH